MQPDRNFGGICDAVGGRLGQLPRLSFVRKSFAASFSRDPTEDRSTASCLCLMLALQAVVVELAAAVAQAAAFCPTTGASWADRSPPQCPPSTKARRHWFAP